MNCNEFIEYLIEQVRNGSIYVWGGQGQKTPTVCEAWIRRREAGTGGTIVNKRYETYADIAVNTWKKRCLKGYKDVLRAFDCSGLGVYWFIKNKLIRYDMNANALRGLCERVTEPRRGYWVFRVKDNRATHIGYLISPTELIEAKDRQDGVVRRAYKPGEWTEIGKPKIFDFDDQPQPEPPQPEKKEYVKVVGASVHVRAGNGTDTKKLGTAHRGDMLPYLGQAEEAPNWYRVEYEGRAAYITNKARYTKLVTKEEEK